MNIIKKLRDKPLKTRKRILWTIIVVLGLILGVLWVYSSYRNIERLKSQDLMQELDLPDFNENLKIELPE